MLDKELAEPGRSDPVSDEIAKLRLARGLDAGAGQTLPAVVASSWRRCLADHRLLPDRVPRATVATHPEIRELCQIYEELLFFAEPEIDKLFLRLVDSECLVSLASPTGAMILLRCDHRLLGEMSRCGVLPGSVWTEEQQGTNGIGTCLREGKPVTIDGSQHYDTAIGSLTCLTAPVFGKFGAIESVLNVTTPRTGDERSNRLVQNIIERAARRIENRYFGRIYRENIILRLSGDSQCTDLSEEARLALDQQGRVVAGTSQVSAFTGRSADELIGSAANDVLERDVHLSSTRPERTFPILVNGKFAYVSLIDPGYPTKSYRAETSPLHESTRPQNPSLPLQKLDLLPDELQFDPITSIMLERARKLLKVGVPLIIKGESGTGRTTFAHVASRRAFGDHAAVIAIDCAASSDLAIAGAVAQASAVIVTGALVLDRIDELGVSGQVALLSVLERNPELGSGRVGLFAVTSTNLDQLKQDGGLRPDLLHRLRGGIVELDSLRTSPDLNGKIDDFLRTELAAQGKSGLKLDEEARLVLANYHWPGNIRELRHAVRHATALAEGKSIGLVHLPANIVSEIARRDLIARSQAEASRIGAALRFNGGNVSRTAKHLGVSRATLYRKIQIQEVRKESAS